VIIRIPESRPGFGLIGSLFSLVRLLSTPSSRKLLPSSRLPLTYGRPLPVLRARR